MRHVGLTLILSMTMLSCRQEIEFDLRQIKFEGLGFNSKRDEIIKVLGQPKYSDKNFDCGFDETGESEKLEQLIFDNFKFVGGYKDKFVLFTIDFDSAGKVKLQFADKELSGLTSKSGLIAIFGDKVKNQIKKDSIFLASIGTDEGASFIFKNDRLIKYKYWTPC